MKEIRAVVFDVGGVLHVQDASFTADMTTELGLAPEAMQAIWATEIPQLGSGLMDETTFWGQISRKYQTRPVVPEENILGRGLAEHLRPMPGVAKVIQALGVSGMTLAVLSNTIEPHARILREAGMYDGFDYIFLSHEIGVRKPDPAAYWRVLHNLELSPSEAAFVDDDRRNVAAAHEVGMYGITFRDHRQLAAELQQLIPGLRIGEN